MASKNINNVINLSQVFPIQEVTDNFLVNGNGDISFGYEIGLPEVFTLSPELYDSLHASLLNLISRLGISCCIHMQSFYFEDTFYTKNKEGNFTKRNNLKYYDQREVLRNYTNLYITISNDRFKKKKNPLRNSFIKLFDYVVNQTLKDVNALINLAYGKEVQVENALKSINIISAKRKTSDQLICALFDYFNLSYERPAKTTDNLVQNPIVFENNQLMIGNKHVALLTMTNEGKNIHGLLHNTTAPANVYGNKIQYSNSIAANTSTAFPIGLGLPINHILNVFIEVADKDAIEPSHTEKQALRLFSAIGYRPAKDKFEEQEGFLDDINTKNFQPCLVGINVILHDVDLKKLENKVAATQTAFYNMKGAVSLTENFDLANLFFASSPGNIRNNYRTFISTIDAAVCYFPKETCYKTDPSGIQLVDRFGCPTVLDMWNSPYLNNRNRVMFAPSGAGKSFAINHLVDQELSLGYHVVMIDIGKSYERSIQINKHQSLYLDSSNKKNLTFNIFICNQDSNGKYLYKQTDEDGEGEDDIINFIYSVIRYIIKGDEESAKIEKTIIKKSIVAYYDYVNKNTLFPNLTGYFEYTKIFEKELSIEYKDIVNFSHIRLLLEAYVTGEYKYLLNSDRNIKLSDYRFVVFELEAIHKNADLVNIVTLIIIKLVGDKVDKLPKSIRKSLYIDEAIDFLKGDIGDFIGAAYRKFRKKEGAVTIATQNVNFLKAANDEVRDSVVGNSDIKILLDHRQYTSAYPDLRQWLSLNSHDIELLQSVESAPTFREFLLKMGTLSRVFRLEVSPETAAVYTTKASDQAEITKLIEVNQNIEGGIYEYVHNKQLKEHENQ